MDSQSLWIWWVRFRGVLSLARRISGTLPQPHVFSLNWYLKGERTMLASWNTTWTVAVDRWIPDRWTAEQPWTAAAFSALVPHFGGGKYAPRAVRELEATQFSRNKQYGSQTIALILKLPTFAAAKVATTPAACCCQLCVSVSVTSHEPRDDLRTAPTS